MTVNAGSNGAAAPAPTGGEESSGPMTFDKMISSGKTSAEDAVEEVVEEEADSGESEEEASESDEGAEEDGVAASSDDKETSDEDGEKKAEEDAPNEDLEEVSAKAKGETVAVKVGSKEFKIPSSAKITVQKDGTTMELTLKEIGNNFVTNREIHQKFSALDREKKTFEREKRDVTKLQIEYADLEDNVSLIRDAAHSGNMFDVAQATLNIFAKGDADVSQQLFDQLLSLTEKVSEMTEDQLKAAVASSQLSFTNSKLKKEKDKTESKLRLREQQDWLSKKLSSQGIGWDEYRERYQALKELNAARVKNGQPAKLTDDMTFEQIANETVSWTMATRIFNKVVGAIEKVSPAHAKNTDLIDAIAQLTEPSSSENDIVEIVREVLKVPRKKVSKPKDLSKEVSKPVSKPQKGTTSKEARPQKATEGKETKKDEGDGPVTFETLKKRYS